VVEQHHLDELTAGLRDLSRIVIADEDVSSTLDRIAALAVHAINGCDIAAVSLVRERGVIETLGATGPEAEEIDRLQYATGEGPCVSSIESHATFRMDDVRTEERWPRFAEAAAGRGVGSMLSLVVELSDRALAALNLYGRLPGAFDDRDVELATVLASQAAVTLANAQTHERDLAKSAQLEEALQTRTVISQAVGILMERQGLTAEEAFDSIRRLSRHINVKVRELATDIVSDSEASPRPPPVDP
jgi:GAF domain-containing protein